jgi:hypothetical protein
MSFFENRIEFLLEVIGNKQATVTWDDAQTGYGKKSDSHLNSNNVYHFTPADPKTVAAW